jgi:glycyl-tRNA synthetase beta chain
MASSLPLLLEIGTEELPSSFVDAALVALPKIVADELAKARLTHGRVTALGTPRRIGFVATDVATRQLDLDEEVIGPPEAAAFKDGKPTRAAEAFASKLGLGADALRVVERAAGPKQKAGRYVLGRRVEAGRPAIELLGGALLAVCAAIPFRKSMRWADLDVAFGRPVHWLVALLGQEVVPLSFAGVRAGRTSRGHRFLAPGPFDVTRPERYVEELRERHVLVDRDERILTMMARVKAAAIAAGGTYDHEPMLVDENASLVEDPYVITGTFDQAFLALPAAVIRAVARGHQKYFCVQTSDDELLPSYVAVVNTANRPDFIARGTDRVMRARLSDARFFWEEDQKAPLDTRFEKLGGIVFHHRLGTVREKVERIQHLVARIADILFLDNARDGTSAKGGVVKQNDGSSAEGGVVKQNDGSSAEGGVVKRTAALRAAYLCKCDLVTLMVGEFPELQGHMGRAYALAQGESREVADALRDHYKPVGAQDDVAQHDISAAIALADRFDTLAGCFAIGLAPTGAADPFALRRACIGALRTILDRGYSGLAFSELVALAYDGFAGKKLDLSKIETIAKIEEFASERLRGLLSSYTSGPVADAVLAVSGPAALGNVAAALARARALQGAVDASEPWLAKAKIVAKRLAGISREARSVLHGAAEFQRSAKKDDLVLQKLVRDLDSATADLATEEAVRAALMQMGTVATELDRIFIETLVNDPADALTTIRLETLAYGAFSMLRIADFSKLG